MTKAKILTINEHLNKARKKAHVVQLKNGHYTKMAKASVLARKKKKLSTRI